MALDAWLDDTDHCRRNRVELFINVQFRDDPPDNSAEAATALLIAWPEIAARLALPIQAWLHRPVRACTEQAGIALQAALQWGCIETAANAQVWTSGLATDGRTACTRALSQSCANAQTTTADIDAALGHAGHAAGWLACALAAEHAKATGEPQLIATQEPAGVVYAVAAHHETKRPRAT